MKIFFLCTSVIINFLLPSFANASNTMISSFIQGSQTLNTSPNYSWWYGCSPTSAGMMLGYYDINGYGGKRYTNLVRNGVAEMSTFPSQAGYWQYVAQTAIASSGHVNAFYTAGYLEKNDDLSRDATSFDCLADFMGTSQDSIENPNGATTFYYYTDGSKLSIDDDILHNIEDKDGLYGIKEYIEYRGYGVTDIFTQIIQTSTSANGYTFEDYKAEINSGKLVMIQVLGHSMLGYGYDDDGTIYINDTWSSELHTMKWGGSYRGMKMWGVTSFALTGGSPVPVPASLWLLGTGALVIFSRTKRN